MFREFYQFVFVAILPLMVGPDLCGGLAVCADETTFSSRALSLTDVVMQYHIDPPARQQMILSGAKSVYVAADRPVPGDLSIQVSQLATEKQLAEFLDRIRIEFSHLDNLESILTEGMLSAVPGDSFLVEAKENAVNQQVLNNRYVGTGISLATNKEASLAQITKVFYDGPAWKAGVKPMDLILEIDGQSAASQSLGEVVEALRGESGSDVEVIVRQPGSSESRKLTMTRGRVFIPTIEGIRENPAGRWNYLLEPKNEIAYLKVKNIGPSTLHELRQIASQLRREKAQGIVLDLREGGGILHDIVMVADSMIDSGTIGFVRTRDNSIEHKAQSGDLFHGLPIVVLVGRTTSAGNVFLTAALQDNKRALVVGEPTGGETFVSRFVSIPNRIDQLKLATGVMSRADGTPLVTAPPLRSNLPASVLEAREPGLVKPGFVQPDYWVRPGRLTGHSPAQDNDDLMLRKAIEVLQEGSISERNSQTKTSTGE